MNVSSLIPVLDPSTSLHITWLLLHFLWQGLVIAAAVWSINLCFSRSARWRYGIAVTGLAAMVVAVMVTWTWLQPTTASLDALPAPIDSGDLPAGASLQTSTLSAASPEASAGSPLEVWAPLASTWYLVGVAVMLLRLAMSSFGAARLRSSGHHVNQELSVRVGELATQVGLRIRPVTKICERIVVPFVAGVVRPVILLPAQAATGMTSAELDAILLHELAHIRRGDLLVNLLQRIVESWLFFHPGVWYVSRVISSERENCCDDVVLRHCSQSVYASALVRVAEACALPKRDASPIAALAAGGAGPSQLKRRLHRILGVRSPKRWQKPGWGMLLSALVLLSVAGFHLRANADKPTTAKADAPERHLTTTLSGDGRKVKFTTDADSMHRLTAILHLLSTNNSVEITSSKISRSGKRVSMTLTGKHLGFRAVQAAVRSAEARRTNPATRSLTYQGSPLNNLATTLRTESLGDVMVVRGLDGGMALATVRAVKELVGEPDGSRDSFFLGPIHIEAMGETIVLKGNPQDLDRVVKIMGNIERLDGQGLPLDSERKSIAAKLKENDRQLATLRAQKEKLSGYFTAKHPQLAALDARIQRALQVTAELKAAKEKLTVRERKSATSKGSGPKDETPPAGKKAKGNELSGPVRIEFLEGTDLVITRGDAKDVQRVEARIATIEANTQKDPPETPSAASETELPQDEKTPQRTGPLRFDIQADGQFQILGKKEDLKRVRRFLDESQARQTASNASVVPTEAVPGITGPVRIEFLEGTDIFIVRGKKEDVDRVMRVVGDRGSQATNPESTTQEQPQADEQGKRSFENELSPEQWDLRRRRYAKFDLDRKNPAAEKISQALNSSVSLELLEQPLADVAAHLERAHPVRVRLDQKALRQQDIDSQRATITINVKNISLRSALRLMLHQLGLTFVIDNDALVITTEEQAEKASEQEAKRAPRFSVFQLRNALADQVSLKLQQIFLDRSTRPAETPWFKADVEHNRVLVKATPDVREEIQRLIAKLDQQPKTKQLTTVYRLQHVSAKDAKEKLITTLGEAGAPDSATRIAVDTRGNALVVVADAAMQPQIAKSLQSIDREDDTADE